MAQNETSQQTAAVAPQEKKQLTTKDYFNQDGVKAKLFEILGKKAPGFITGVLQTVASNEKLRKADPSTIYQAAAIAAVLDLPINNSLGKAYIVPYNESREDEQGRKYTVCVAQFQMGYKGFIELAIRSSNFKTINVTDVKEGEILAHDRLTGNIDWAWINNPKDRDKLPTIAYVAYIETNSGFRKSMLMYKEEIEKHGKRYSKTYTFSTSLWKTDFDKMAKKTVLKLLLSGYATLSIEIRDAIKYDQAVVKDFEKGEAEYPDNDFTNYEEVEIDALELDALFDSQRAKCTPDEIADIERILKAGETKSFKKVFTELKKKEAVN